MMACSTGDDGSGLGPLNTRLLSGCSPAEIGSKIGMHLKKAYLTKNLQKQF